MKISDIRIRLVSKEDNKLLPCRAEKLMMANIRILHTRLTPRPEI